MAGYRQSSYDPNPSAVMGKPLRPYNRVQWSGVALCGVGLAIYLVEIASRFGWIRSQFDDQHISFPIVMFGVILISSRREPDPAPDLARARHRWMIIILAIAVAVLGLAAVIEYTGA